MMKNCKTAIHCVVNRHDKKNYFKDHLFFSAALLLWAVALVLYILGNKKYCVITATFSVVFFVIHFLIKMRLSDMFNKKSALKSDFTPPSSKNDACTLIAKGATFTGNMVL